MFGESLYRSREEKAANLLYLVIKDHPFSDGNKRIGSFLFMLYLQQEDMAQRLDPRALTALALLIAESAPASKDLMVRLIINLLDGSGRMSGFTESVVEEAALAWLEALGYAVLHGPEIAAGEPGAERSDPNYRDVVLERPAAAGARAPQSRPARRGAGGCLPQADAQPMRRR